MNTSRPISPRVVRELKTVLRADRGKRGFCWNGCPGLRLADGQASFTRPDFLGISAGESLQGEVDWPAVIFHRKEGRWKILDYGSDVPRSPTPRGVKAGSVMRV